MNHTHDRAASFAAPSRPGELFSRPALNATGMEFGIFDHLDRCDVTLHAIYENRLELIAPMTAPASTPITSPSITRRRSAWRRRPSVFLAAVAQRTHRLRFGPLVYALPLYHPLRMIEEICMLDQMSGGRLEFGFGRGSSPIELDYYGEDPAEGATGL